jgi:hypothetical protein
MRKNAVYRLFVLVLALTGALLAQPVQAQGGGGPSLVVPINSQYAELSARWWQWVFGQTVSTHPLFDTTGQFAPNGQPENGDVFFLAGLISPNQGLQASVTRTITIPTGTRLFFPLLNTEWDNVGVDPPFSIEQLRALAAFGVDQVTSLYAALDGEPLQDLFHCRTKSPVFGYVMPSTDNLYQFFGYDFSGAAYPAVADGYYLLLKPLKQGPHVLKFGGTTNVLDANGAPAVFALDITYYITVQHGKK